MKITAGHPFRGSDLAEEDAIEVSVIVFNRQHAATLLSQVRGCDPHNERFILELDWLRSMHEESDRDS